VLVGEFVLTERMTEHMTEKRKYKDGSYEIDCPDCEATGMQRGCTFNNPRVCERCNGHAVLLARKGVNSVSTTMTYAPEGITVRIGKFGGVA
jgi:DnaJ-class molecular chaperone